MVWNILHAGDIGHCIMVENPDMYWTANITWSGTTSGRQESNRALKKPTQAISNLYYIGSSIERSGEGWLPVI
jgi:hypothetical protein